MEDKDFEQQLKAIRQNLVSEWKNPAGRILFDEAITKLIHSRESQLFKEFEEKVIGEEYVSAKQYLDLRKMAEGIDASMIDEAAFVTVDRKVKRQRLAQLRKEWGK